MTSGSKPRDQQIGRFHLLEVADRQVRTPDSVWRTASPLWWAEFSLQTKLLAIATLVVSLMMTGITFLRSERHPARMPS